MENLRFDGVLGNDGIESDYNFFFFFFLREKLEIGNEKFLVSKFLFLFSERRDDEKFIYFSSSRACYYNKISRHSIETRLKSWMDFYLGCEIFRGISN